MSHLYLSGVYSLQWVKWNMVQNVFTSVMRHVHFVQGVCAVSLQYKGTLNMVYISSMSTYVLNYLVRPRSGLPCLLSATFGLVRGLLFWHEESGQWGVLWFKLALRSALEHSVDRADKSEEKWICMNNISTHLTFQIVTLVADRFHLRNIKLKLIFLFLILLSVSVGTLTWPFCVLSPFILFY